MGLFGSSHYLRRRLVYLNTFQISWQSESVSMVLIHFCLLHTKHFQSRFMEADGFTVASHAGVFRGACFPHNEKRAPLKTPAWKASFTDARGKFMENGTSMGHSTYVLTIRLLDEHGHICQDWDLSRWKLRCFEFRIEGTLDQFKNVQTNPLIRLKFLNGFPQLARTLGRGTQRQFSENNCSEDDLRSRIFGTFVVKFLTCLPLLAGIFENLKNGIIAHF